MKFNELLNQENINIVTNYILRLLFNNFFKKIGYSRSIKQNELVVGVFSVSFKKCFKTMETLDRFPKREIYCLYYIQYFEYSNR